MARCFPWATYLFCDLYEIVIITMYNLVIAMLLQDVAIKVFSKQEYSEDVILAFRQEVYVSNVSYYSQLLCSWGLVNVSYWLCDVL